MTNFNPKSIFVLSALDKLISEHKSNPALLCAIFQQKESIINLLQTGKIDSNKYKKIIATAYKEETGVVKACAEEDIQKLANPKDPKQLQAWFKLMIDNTGLNYQKQQKLYKHYQAQLAPPSNVPPVVPSKPIQNNPQTAPQPNIQKPKQAQQKPNQSGPNIQDIVSFKYLDSLMDDQEKAENYQKWYDRKKKLWDLVLKKQLTAQKYKASLQLVCNRLKGGQLADDYRFQLTGIVDFHDGKPSEWFKEIIEQTQDNFQSQTQKLKALLKGPSTKKQQTGQKKLPQPTRQSYRQSTSLQASKKKKPLGFDIAQINSFRVFDECLEQQSQNKNNYKEVLQKKKKFLQHVKNGVLNGQKYKALLYKCIDQCKNTDIKQSMEFQLSQLTEFHNNVPGQWFKEVIANAKIMIQEQQEGLKLLQQGKKIPKKQDSDDDIDLKMLDDDDQDLKMLDDDDDLIQVKIETAKPVAKKETINPPVKKESKPNQYSQFFSLKALDQIMSQNEKNSQTFCLCFERKQEIFALMQKGEIDAQKYKTLQEKSFKTSTNQKLKECIEMDLFDLKDMCSGNVNQWFQSLINDSGFNFQEQQEKYQKFKGKGNPPAPSKQQSQAQKPTQKGQELQKPNIAQVVCFSALQKLFEYSIKTLDLIYYKQLCGKREKLIELVKSEKLIPNKYKQINKVAATKTQNPFLKKSIQEQLLALSSKFKDNEQVWFQSLKKTLFQSPPQLKLPQSPMMKKINSLPIQQKIQYLAKRMAPYQSLVVYYNTHKLNANENPHIETYVKKKKKQAFQAIPMAQKDKQFDIFNLVQQLFPPIDSQIFYGGNLAALKKKSESFTGAFAQEIAALKDYATKIKKATNPQNLQNTKKQIAQCQQNIATLKSWPGKQLIPLPIVTQQKVERYNLDVHSYLDNNEVEVNITYVQGMKEDLFLKIYAGQTQNQRFWVKIRNGPQGNAKTIIKLPPKQMADLMKGDKPVITVKFFDKNFFGSWKLVEGCTLQGSFGRNNLVEDKANAGQIRLNYEMRVHKPTKPLVTDITHATLKLLPAFEVDGAVMKQLIKECVSHLHQ